MKTAFYIFLLLLLGACASNSLVQSNRQTTQQPVAFYYTMPATLIGLDFTFIKETTIPGPFSIYAQKYLGIKGAPTVKHVNWELSSLNTRSFMHPDDSKLIKVIDEQGTLLNSGALTLTRAGLIVNPSVILPAPVSDVSIPANEQLVYFTDLSVKRNFEKTGTLERHNPSANFSYQQKVLEAKTLEEKAEEAANFIIKTRKRRFKLLAGQYDFLPEAGALALSVKELNKTEEEYLSLFTGTTFTDTIHYKVYIKPGTNVPEEHKTILYFSTDGGPSGEYVNGSYPLELHLYNQSKAYVNTAVPDSAINKIYYRVPGMAEMQVHYKSKQIFIERLSVYQYGKVVEIAVQ